MRIGDGVVGKRMQCGWFLIGPFATRQIMSGKSARTLSKQTLFRNIHFRTSVLNEPFGAFISKEKHCFVTFISGRRSWMNPSVRLSPRKNNERKMGKRKRTKGSSRRGVSLVHWFRNKGLRLDDNPALKEALVGAKTFRCVYILDPWFARSPNQGVNKWRYVFLVFNTAWSWGDLSYLILFV